MQLSVLGGVGGYTVAAFYVIYSVCVCLGNRNPELSQDLFVIVDNRPMLSCMGNTFIHYI